MTYDKTKDQMPLFEMPTVKKGKEKARKIGSKAAGNITNEKKKHPVGVTLWWYKGSVVNRNHVFG